MKVAASLFALSLVVLVQQSAVSQPATDTGWHQEPFRIKSGERLLDTFDNDPGGHAAPFLADVDGDGRRDLTVGSIQGRFHFYKNIGTDAAPRFGDKSTFLMAGLSADEPARVPNFCCVASGPQMVDVDGDGILDLTSGSYYPGQVYWFKGRGDGSFQVRQTLTDINDRPVLPCPEENGYLNAQGSLGNYMTNLAWTDWDANGHPDMILGNFDGHLFVRLNARDIWGDISSMPSSSQPVFSPKDEKVNEILIDGEKAVPDHHGAPAVADWDGDGLWDILAGTESGRVYWFRNSGKPGAPVFKDRQEIVGPGAGWFWVEPGQAPGRGIRSQIQAVDYNFDGKMDLLVGEWSVVQTPRPDLTRAERRKMEVVRKELKVLDERMGFTPEYIVRYKVDGYNKDKEALKRAQLLETELTKYLVKYSQDEMPDYMKFLAFQKYAGHVWVFLRK